MKHDRTRMMMTNGGELYRNKRAGVTCPRPPRISLAEVAEKYGMSRSNAAYHMDKSGISVLATGFKKKLYYIASEVDEYMRSIGKLPK